MDRIHALPSSPADGASSWGWRDSLRNAIRYWEPRRAVYNVVLAAIAIVWLLGTWPHFRPALALSSLVPLSILVVSANLCYSAAYLAEIVLRSSLARTSWRRGRWGIWLAGMLFAVLVENYWIADEIYPSVR